MLTKAIKTFDLISPSHSISYSGTKTSKSLAGAAGTIIVTAVFVLTVISFGMEVIEKKNPTAKVVKQISEDSTIYLKNYPFMLAFANRFVFTPEVFEKEFDVVARINEVALIDGTQTKVGHFLSFEPCKPEFIAEADPQFQVIDISPYFCINPFVKFDSEGNRIEEDIFIRSTESFIGESILEFGLLRKANRINLPFDEEIVIATSYAINIVDSSNLEKPVAKTLYTKFIVLGTELGVTNTYVVANDQLESDEGFLTKNVKKQTFVTTRSVDLEYTLISETTPWVATFTLNSSLITEKYEREYKKIQTVVAEASGVVKIIMVLAKILVSYLNDFSFYKQNASILLSKRKKFSAKQNQNDSQDLIINSKPKPNEANPSIIQYFFTSKPKFESQFVPKSLVEKEFDLLEIRKELEELKEFSTQFEQNRVIQLRR